MIKKSELISVSLRAGLGIVFLYSAISSFLQPTNWIGFVPDFVELIMSKETFLIIFSIFELILGILILSNYKTFATSIISSITIFAITIGNIGALEIIFRDFAILLMSIALNILSYKENPGGENEN